MENNDLATLEATIARQAKKLAEAKLKLEWANHAEEMNGIVLRQVELIKQHFNDDFKPLGNGMWRLENIGESCRVMVAAEGNCLEQDDATLARSKHNPLHDDTICNGCGKPLVAENCWMDDGCPCNTERGVNDGNQQISEWRREREQEAQHQLATAAARIAELERVVRESIEIFQQVPVDIAVSGDVRRPVRENQFVLRPPKAAMSDRPKTKSAKYGDIEVRAPEDELDEIFGEGTLHLEQMSDGHWWFSFTDKSGHMIHCNLWGTGKKIKSHGEVEHEVVARVEYEGRIVKAKAKDFGIKRKSL